MNILFSDGLNVMIEMPALSLAANGEAEILDGDAMIIGGDSVYNGDYGMDGYVDGGYDDGSYIDGGDGTGSSFSPMASMPFIIGITVVSLAVSVGLGMLFAKLKIKKGIDVYED